jgi:hypothetical protein
LAIDEAQVAEDARFDGVFVLRTNTTLDPLQAMRRYHELQGVEQLFRSAKSLLATRPIFHKCDATIRGHVFCSFLALMLKRRSSPIAAPPETSSPSGTTCGGTWIVLQEVEVEQDGKHFILRTPRPPAAPASCSRRLASPCRPTSATPISRPPIPSPNPPYCSANT